MKAVWKFHLSISDEQTIRAPEGMRPVSVAMQGGAAVMWGIVETDNQVRDCQVFIHGTGHEIASNLPFVGTIMLHNDALIFHVFCAGN